MLLCCHARYCGDRDSLCTTFQFCSATVSSLSLKELCRCVAVQWHSDIWPDTESSSLCIVFFGGLISPLGWHLSVRDTKGSAVAQSPASTAETVVRCRTIPCETCVGNWHWNHFCLSVSFHQRSSLSPSYRPTLWSFSSGPEYTPNVAVQWSDLQLNRGSSAHCDRLWSPIFILMSPHVRVGVGTRCRALLSTSSPIIC